MGIERESQSLGYGVQEVDGETLNEARETHFTNALAGKVAGLDVHLRNRGDIIPTPWVSQPDNVKDFFELAQTLFNNVAVAGSNDNCIDL